MTDYLADVVMPELEPQPEPEPSPDAIIDEHMGADTDYPTEEEIIIEPVKKPKIPQEEIFTPPKVKTILEPELPTRPPTPKKTRQTRKKRGPASEEQLERLARGRLKANETRARKKALKEEQSAKDKSDKDLVEAVREKERKKLRKRLEEPDEGLPPKVTERIVEKDRIIEKGYSQEDLDDAVSRAVEQSVNRVETLRKQRKEVKKKAEAKANHDAKVFREINSALKNDVWADCFL